jgi:hypothetical protein
MDKEHKALLVAETRKWLENDLKQEILAGFRILAEKRADNLHIKIPTSFEVKFL